MIFQKAAVRRFAGALFVPAAELMQRAQVFHRKLDPPLRVIHPGMKPDEWRTTRAERRNPVGV